MKALFGLLVVFLCAGAAHADTIATFQVEETTFLGTIPATTTPATDVQWIISGPTNGAPVSLFATDLPTIFEMFGIAPFGTAGPSTISEHPIDCTIVAGMQVCSEEFLLYVYATSLPPGIDKTTTATIDGPIQTPEPMSAILVCAGLLALGLRRRRAKNPL